MTRLVDAELTTQRLVTKSCREIRMLVSGCVFGTTSVDAELKTTKSCRETRMLA